MATVLRNLTFFMFLVLAVDAHRCDEETLLKQRLRGERNRTSLNPLGLELSDGKLDFLAEDNAPYTAQEVGCIAANMASNMFRNGTVVAAPAKVSSNHSNDYYFMWQRDAAMSMRSLLRVIVDAPNRTFASSMSNTTSAIRNQFMSYTLLLPNLWNQSDPNTLCPPWYKETPGWCVSMGEPKFFVNGSVYTKSWGRPQNDGPALAAVFMGEFFNAILDVEDEIPDADELQHKIFGGGGTTGVLYDALNFVNTWYNEGSVGPWEEVYGRQFFVSEVQRLALKEGVRVCNRKGFNSSVQWPKSGYANWVYSAKNLATVSKSFVSEDLVQATAGRQQGLAGPKCSNSEPLLQSTGEVWPKDLRSPCELDVQTLIVTNFVAAGIGDPVLPPHDHRIINTAGKIVESMARYYEVNAVDRTKGLVGLLIGRYPGDTYCGYGACPKTDYGNPWFIATHALAEFLYFVARAWCEDRLTIEDAKALSVLWKQLTRGAVTGWNALEMADSVMKNAKEHVVMPGVHMSEQIKKNGPDVGQQAGVPDLTWSYASALSALLARHKAIAACRKT